MNILFDLYLVYNLWRIINIFIVGLVRGLCKVLLLSKMSGFRGYGHPIFLMLRLGLLGLCFSSFFLIVLNFLIVLAILLCIHVLILVSISPSYLPSSPNPQNSSHPQSSAISPIPLSTRTKYQNMRNLK